MKNIKIKILISLVILGCLLVNIYFYFYIQKSVSLLLLYSFCVNNFFITPVEPQAWWFTCYVILILLYALPAIFFLLCIITLKAKNILDYFIKILSVEEKTPAMDACIIWPILTLGISLVLWVLCLDLLSFLLDIWDPVKVFLQTKVLNIDTKYHSESYNLWKGWCLTHPNLSMVVLVSYLVLGVGFMLYRDKK